MRRKLPSRLDLLGSNIKDEIQEKQFETVRAGTNRRKEFHKGDHVLARNFNDKAKSRRGRMIKVEEPRNLIIDVGTNILRRHGLLREVNTVREGSFSSIELGVEGTATGVDGRWQSS